MNTYSLGDIANDSFEHHIHFHYMPADISPTTLGISYISLNSLAYRLESWWNRFAMAIYYFIIITYVQALL